MLAVILGSLLALGTVAVIVVLTSGKRLPTIDQTSFDAAQKLWNESGPKSYDIQVAVTGYEPAVYDVAVRDGEVKSFVMNGAPLRIRLGQCAWSVRGMFNTISDDVKHATDPIRTGTNEVNYIQPQGTFDSQYGYPARYRRIAWGGDQEVSWVVTKFALIPR